MKYSDEASDTEQQLMRAPFVRNSADAGMKLAAVILAVCGAIVLVIVILH